MPIYLLLFTATFLILFLGIEFLRQTRRRALLQELERKESEFKQSATKTLHIRSLTDLNIAKTIQSEYAGCILTASEQKLFARPYTTLFQQARKLSDKRRALRTVQNEEIEKYIREYLNIPPLLKQHNDKVKRQILSSHKDFFDHCLAYPLDSQQRMAIISEEENCLVVSSAGSGKTSSIVGKVNYLIRIRHVQPHKILLISYTNKAAAELTERIGTPGLTGYTFHKLALNIMARQTGCKPNLCENTDRLFVQIYRRLVQENPKFQKAVLSYFVDFPNDEEDWSIRKKERQNQLSEAKQVQQKALFPDMDGNEIRVRSAQEKKLCFILTALGVDFRYEEPYEFNVEDEMHSQYRPDFSIYFTKNGKRRRIYLEHYGTDEHGLVPLWFAQEKNLTYEEINTKYNDGITWKSETHKKYGTTLITTSSADFRYLDVKKELKTKLQRAGVPVHEKTPAELYNAILPEQGHQEKSFVRFIVTFVTLLKSSCKSVTEILRNAENAADERAAFIIREIFIPVYKAYEEKLRLTNQIDFTDAILQATEICKAANKGYYDYIIVDEFQDISMDRYEFLKALRQGNPPARLFCVGDDWQSIYRFSGSDMTLFSKFSKYFGPTEINRIETTYRFGQPLVSLSSAFIQRNPHQLHKEIRPFDTRCETRLLLQAYNRAHYSQAVESLIQTIPADKSIFLLGRYSFDDYYLSFKYKSIREGHKTFYIIQGRKIEFLTVHKSKGLEADYVILLQCNKDNFGFPSLIQDDPVLNYVLSEKDGFPFSEERRLFYVAITRARVCTYVLYDVRFPSVFVQELLHPEQLTESSFKRHRNANLRWTRKADQLLWSLYQEKKTIAYISQKMGRSQTSIVMRLNKILAK